MNLNRGHLLYLIGIGAFAYLCISAIRSIFHSVTTDLLMVFASEFTLIYWGTEIIPFLVFISLSYFIIKYLVGTVTKPGLPLRKAFLFFFIGYFVLLLLQFLYTYYITGIIIENFPENFKEYYSKRSGRFGVYTSIFSIGKVLVFGLIFLWQSRRFQQEADPEIDFFLNR